MQVNPTKGIVIVGSFQLSRRKNVANLKSGPAGKGDKLCRGKEANFKTYLFSKLQLSRTGLRAYLSFSLRNQLDWCVCVCVSTSSGYVM